MRIAVLDGPALELSQAPTDELFEVLAIAVLVGDRDVEDLTLDALAIKQARAEL